MNADDKQTEKKLVQEALDNPEAFHRLYELYLDRIYGYVASRIGDTHDAEDIVSNVFLQVFQKLDQLNNQYDLMEKRFKYCTMWAERI